MNREKEASHRYKRLYFDSKYRTGGTPTTFAVVLPETLEMSHNHRFCVDDICLPRSWYNVSHNNNYIYVSWITSSIYYLRRATLTPGDYDGITLATEMTVQLNTLSKGTFSCVFSRTTGRITISNSTTSFKIETDPELIAIGVKQAYNLANNIVDAEFDVPQIYSLSKEGHKSFNYVAGNLISQSIGTIKILEPINLNWLDTVYMHSSIGSYNTLNLRGEKTIVKEIKIDAQPFTYIFDNANTDKDWLDCSNQTWSSISFALRDKNGNDIDLNNRDISFSIVLDDLTL